MSVDLLFMILWYTLWFTHSSFNSDFRCTLFNYVCSLLTIIQAGDLYVVINAKIRRKTCCAFRCHPSLRKTFDPKVFIEPLKSTGVVFVCFGSFTETKLFPSSLLWCSIFTLIFIGTIQFVTGFMSYVILCEM